ncbi:MAG: prephenate dehydrogenase [Microbacteriaceae bacterium]
MTSSRVSGPIRIVGTGLLGTSIGLVLRRHGVEVTLVDASPTAVRLASEYGAGNAATDSDAPMLIVVATPPDVVADVVAAEIARFPDAVVTDVASVKGSILESLESHGIDLSNYVGSHPMAGRERGGAVAARADLFTGRAWIVCTRPDVNAEAVAVIRDLAEICGANVVELETRDHDSAVALVSHVPQIVSSAVASSLVGARDDYVTLAGGGLRDVTRIAASDPTLWIQILTANAEDVAGVLRGVRDRLETVLAALDAGAATAVLADLLAAGNTGVARIPGKHGNSAQFAQILVIIDDTPGQLAKLLTDIGELGVNMEDLRLEHSPGSQVGFAEVSVIPSAEDELVAALEARGWRIAGEGR